MCKRCCAPSGAHGPAPPSLHGNLTYERRRSLSRPGRIPPPARRRSNDLQVPQRTLCPLGNPEHEIPPGGKLRRVASCPTARGCAKCDGHPCRLGGVASGERVRGGQAMRGEGRPGWRRCRRRPHPFAAAGPRPKSARVAAHLWRLLGGWRHRRSRRHRHGQHRLISRRHHRHRLCRRRRHRHHRPPLASRPSPHAGEEEQWTWRRGKGRK